MRESTSEDSEWPRLTTLTAPALQINTAAAPEGATLLLLSPPLPNTWRWDDMEEREEEGLFEYHDEEIDIQTVSEGGKGQP